MDNQVYDDLMVIRSDDGSSPKLSSPFFCFFLWIYLNRMKLRLLLFLFKAMSLKKALSHINTKVFENAITEQIICTTCCKSLTISKVFKAIPLGDNFEHVSPLIGSMINDGVIFNKYVNTLPHNHPSDQFSIHGSVAIITRVIRCWCWEVFKGSPVYGSFRPNRDFHRFPLCPPLSPHKHPEQAGYYSSVMVDVSRTIQNIDLNETSVTVQWCSI